MENNKKRDKLQRKRDKLQKKWVKDAKWSGANSLQIYIVILLLGVIFPCVILSISEPSLIPFIIVLLFGIMIPFEIAVYKKKKEILSLINLRKSFVTPPDSLVKPIKKTINEFRNTIKFNKKISILVDTQDPSINAMVLSDKTKNYLLLSLGFFLYFKKNADQAKSILAHEYCHIFRKDSRRWIGLSVAATYSKKFWFPVASIILVVTFLCFWLKGIPIFSFGINFFVASILLTFIVPRHRRQAEVAADLGAILLTSPESLSKALSEIGVESTDHTDNFNPSKEWRLNKINKLLNKNKYLSGS